MALAMHRMYLLLLVWMGYLGPAVSFSNGNIGVACGDMVPQHGYEPSPDPAPYEILLDKSTISPGDHVTVTLQGASPHTYFEGFLIEARDAERPNSTAVGSFSLVDPRVSRLLRCGPTQQSGVSHRSRSKKSNVQFMWESPKNSPESIRFFVTVVQTYKVYWVRVPGPAVFVKGATAIPTISTTAGATTPPALTTAFSSEGCGSSKSCLRDPAGCSPDSDPRCFFLSFTTEEDGRSVTFELSGPAEGYVSFSLSLDRLMGNDDVYLCVREDSQVTISAAYVLGRTHPELTPEVVLWDQAWRLFDGVIQCRFRRNTFFPQLENSFSLNQSYFLCLAHGRAHNGVLMLTAWMWIVSTGVLIARHFKRQWPNTTLFGHVLWFQVHRALMLLAVGLTCSAFILPFLYRGGWSQRAGPHPYIGCTVLALSAIQVVMAVLRPAPESSRRYIFNWMHFGTGTAGQVLAVVCIFLGVKQQALLLPGPWCTAVLTGWLLWVVLTDVLLQLHAHCARRGTAQATAQKHREDRHLLWAQPEDQQQDEVSTLKKGVLVVFLIGNTVFLGVLVNAIRNV